MSILRKPQINAAIIMTVSLFYGVIFIFTSGHIEFLRLLNHSQSLNSEFWNGWSEFLRQGNMKYFGYAYIFLAAAIVLFSLFKRGNYDEYQVGVLEKGLIVAGIAMMLLFPMSLFLILSDPNYAVETVMFLVISHWSVVLVADLGYVVKWGKG